jgi:phytoene dehydrogenase-like protein
MSFMTVQPVDRPGTGALAASLAFGRQRHSWTLPRGGSGALPIALARYVEAHGGAVLTSARVTGLVVEAGRCVGVETADGRRHLAGRAVLSTLHVKHLVELAPDVAWGDAFRFGVDTWRAGVSMFVAHYATTEPPRFPVDGGTVESVASGTPQSVGRMLRLGSEFTRGMVATDDPVLLVLAPTVADPTRAPDGRHTLKIVGFQPYELDGGPERWDLLKDGVAEANLAADVLLASHVKSPLDLERFNPHNWHGSCHGGDMGPAQSGALRPAPGWAGHRTPLPGLYQTGATTHPGGSVSAAPGRNAAMVLLEDLGFDHKEVLAGA